MAIRRLRRPPRAIPLTPPKQTFYEVRLSATPRRPGAPRFSDRGRGVTTLRFTPDLGRLGLDGARVTFRTTPRRLDDWLGRIDGWIAYANSVVDE